MKIKALNALAIVGEGNIVSIGYGDVAEVDDTLGASLISEGLAEAYTLVSPTGNLAITENGTDIDVYNKATVSVAVPNPSTGSLSITENGDNIDVTNYAAVNVNVPNPSTGKLEITGTAEVDCTAYASAQVVDANLIAENIKKDVTILGVTGSYEA